MNPDQIKASIQAVIDGLTPLAQKLGIAVESIFTWAIKYNYAQAGIGLFEALSIIPIAIYYVKFMRWGFGSDRDCSYNRFSEDGGKLLLATVFSLFVLIMLVVAIVGVETAISRIIAPEWNASKDIYELIKN
jgi:uncharacterized membrane protein